MSYVTGSVSNFTDLKTAIETEAVAAGWTLTSGILSKGNAFVKFEVLTSTRAYLAMSMGDGQSGSTLTNAQARKLVFRDNSSGHTFTFPITYYIHAFSNPNEIYVSIKYNTDYWQHMAFGQSKRTDIGKGIWMVGTANDNTISGTYNVTITCTPSGTWAINSFSKFVPMFMGTGSTGANTSCAFIYCNIGSGDAWNDMASPALANIFYLFGMPNLLSTDEMILPVKQLVTMPAPNTSYVYMLGIFENARMHRNDNLEPGAVFTVGDNNWKSYPCFSKNTTTRNGGSAVFHSGTFAFAVRYDGP